MKNGLIRKTAILLVLLLVWMTLPLQRSDAEDQWAENLSGQCKYSGTVSVHKDRLTDDDFESAQRVAKGKTISIEWNDSVPARSVLLSFYYDPVMYTVMQYDAKGTLLFESEGTLLWNSRYDLDESARKITVRADADDFALCSLYVYGDGEVPDYHPYEQTPEKADYMLIAMHPDDDVLFLGAIIPTYGVQRGLEGVAVYMGTRLRIRRQEALNGAWIMGLRTLPVFGGFPDIPPEYYNKFKNTFTKDDVVRYIVTILRKYRPEVVVSHDLNGEYGHWQHKLLAEGVDARVPIEGLGGKTAFDAATEAFQCHQSQLPSRHSVQDQGIYSLTDFGLAYTTVGADSPGVNDMFEHIGSEAVSTATEEPTEEPIETPNTEPTEQVAEPNETAKTTEEPTEPPTEQPTQQVEAAHTRAPEAMTQPAADEKPNESGRILLFAGGGLVALLVVLVIALLIVRKRR